VGEKVPDPVDVYGRVQRNLVTALATMVCIPNASVYGVIADALPAADQKFVSSKNSRQPQVLSFFRALGLGGGTS